jgi:hypothetical protein
VGRLLDVFRRGEIRFAGTEVDDVHTLAAQAIGLGGDAKRRGGGDTGHPTGEHFV